MSDMNEINSENVMHHPLFRMIMRSVVVMPNNNIEQRSFDQQIKKDTPCTDKFIEELETMSIVQEDIDNNLSCAICQEEFKLDEKVKELPCGIQKHYFHFEHSGCPGVIPWLQKNNNCPVCRYKFPKKEEETTIEITNTNETTEETTEETTTDEDIQQINIDINNFVNEILISQPMDVVRDGFLDSDVDEAMRRSLNE